MLQINHQTHILFEYDIETEVLECPYCHITYNFNNSKLRSSFISKIHVGALAIDLTPIAFRCIDCALNNPSYPFRLNDVPLCQIKNKPQ